MDQERFAKQLAFILEADKEKNILRQTHLSGRGRQENDAEHAWHMAIMIWLLKEYANEEIDVAKTMMMALIHDIVESSGHGSAHNGTAGDHSSAHYHAAHYGATGDDSAHCAAGDHTATDRGSQ